MHISHSSASNHSHLQAWATPALDQTPSLAALMSTLDFQKIVLLLNALNPTIVVWSNAIGGSYENWVSTVSALSRLPVVFVDGVRQESGRTAHLSVRKWGTLAQMLRPGYIKIGRRLYYHVSVVAQVIDDRLQSSALKYLHPQLVIWGYSFWLFFNHLTIWKKYI